MTWRPTPPTTEAWAVGWHNNGLNRTIHQTERLAELAAQRLHIDAPNLREIIIYRIAVWEDAA